MIFEVGRALRAAAVKVGRRSPPVAARSVLTDADRTVRPHRVKTAGDMSIV
jgi:hypothetical protein